MSERDKMEEGDTLDRMIRDTEQSIRDAKDAEDWNARQRRIDDWMERGMLLMILAFSAIAAVLVVLGALKGQGCQ